MIQSVSEFCDKQSSGWKKPSLVPLIWADLGLMVIKTWTSFSRLFDLFFVASKRLIFFFTICDQISSCDGIVLWSSPSWITWILRFDCKWLITFGAWTSSFGITEHKLNFGVCWALLYKNGSKLLIFFDY